MSDERHLTHLPAILAEIAEATTLGVALMLAREFGGTRILIPSRPRAGDKLSRAVGLDAARAIAGLYGGMRVDIPLAQRRRRLAAVAEMTDKEVSVSRQARTLNTTERTIYRHRARLKRSNSKQGRLL